LLHRFRLFVAAIGLLFIGGCDTSAPCSAIDCLNFGLCADGECLCVAGYEGAVCENVIRDRFLGTHTVQELCTQVAPFTYQLGIATGQGGAESIIIANFGNRVIGVNATISGNGITIPPQHISVQSGWVDVSGSGLIGDSTIVFYYELNDGAEAYECNITIPIP
jgi:hypothetical protein